MCGERLVIESKIILALYASGILLQTSNVLSTNAQQQRQQTCNLFEIKCDSGECVRGFNCDGNIDCKDSSDETLEKCHNFLCPPVGFRCDYGGCVDADAKCNGEKNCPDNSDEKTCPATCKPNQFLCNSNICISGFLRCDGTKDCDDGSDETLETCQDGTKCPGFQCDYGGCIDADGLCNGIVQCADGSDEKPDKCISKKRNTTKITITPIAPAHSAGCSLPLQPTNGQYKLHSCDPPTCSPVPGHRVHNTFINYTCHNGFILSGSEFIYCDKDWSASFPTCSQVSCEPLDNPTRDIECNLNETKVECYKPMAPGTIATVYCNLHYTNSKELADFDTECKTNGKWTRELTSCQPKCGESNPAGVPFISNARQSEYGEYPWHAGLYKLTERGFLLHCGGNIISEHVIVTVAHCFWNQGLSEMFDINLYKVAVGKYYIDWNNTMEQYVQFPEIDDVKLHEMFRGNNRRFENDIALIILKEKIHMTDAVRPICVDYRRMYSNYFTPGKRGIVVGWGTTEKMQPSETLRTATLPYVNFSDCEHNVPESFLTYLTSDRFCAGYNNGTSVCPGDSGGGYATQFKDGKWYLMGLVSVGVPGKTQLECSQFFYTTFTKVFQYYDWIKKYKSSK